MDSLSKEQLVEFIKKQKAKIKELEKAAANSVLPSDKVRPSISLKQDIYKY